MPRGIYVRTDEIRQKMSLSHLGHVDSPETRVKKSLAHMGMTQSPEAIAKTAAANVGKRHSEESLAKMSVSHSNQSDETRMMNSLAHKGRTHLTGALTKWKGGRKASSDRHHSKRRILGFNPLNSPFIDCEGHHVNPQDVIYVPKTLHKSIKHNIWTGKNMDAMNIVAYDFLTKQEA